MHEMEALGQTLMMLNREHQRAVSAGDYDFYRPGKCEVCAMLIRHGLTTVAHDAEAGARLMDLK